MAPRPYWKGYLKLSLVSCPVALYPASTQAEKTHFHQINTRTGNRLRQQMIDEETGRTVQGDQKGRGYELSKGRYVEIEEEELKAVELESTHTIDIDTFVPKAEIDERYIEKPYYIVPNEESGEDAFSVIRDAMRDKDKVALGRIVMAHREHVIAIQPFGKGLLATTLRYPYELRDPADVFDGIPDLNLPAEMKKLATHIVDTKAAHFEPKAFEDHYEKALVELLKNKQAGLPLQEVGEDKPAPRVINLMDALRASIKGDVKKPAAASTGARRPAAKKKAASR